MMKIYKIIIMHGIIVERNRLTLYTVYDKNDN